LDFTLEFDGLIDVELRRESMMGYSCGGEYKVDGDDAGDGSH
jgi:hypothetical protein